MIDEWISLKEGGVIMQKGIGNHNIGDPFDGFMLIKEPTDNT